jgi:hypothetical protein
MFQTGGTGENLQGDRASSGAASLPAYRTALLAPQSFVSLLLLEIGGTALLDGGCGII